MAGVTAVDTKVLTSSTDLTPEFLTSALQTHFPGASVLRCRCEPLVGERGMAASVLRIHLSGDHPALPASVILKLPPSEPALRNQVNDMGFFQREVGFYRHLSEHTPVHTATCYSADFDPETGDAYLLLEDLAPARNGSSPAAGTVEEVAAVLLALARMHARWWQDETLAHHAWLGLHSMLAPSGVAEIFERSWPSFLHKLSIPVDEEILTMKAWISSAIHEASITLYETGPRTLIHNDVQGDNVFFTNNPDRSVMFIDWQLSTYGRGVVDVANAVRGSLEPDVRRSAERELIRGYHKALVRGGVSGYPISQCESDYTLATVIAPARLATAVGLHGGVAAHPGAPWDTLFPRLARS